MVPGKEGTLYYRVTHHRISRQIGTGHKLYAGEWNPRGAIIFRDTGNPARLRYLHTLEEQVRKDLERLRKLIRQLDRSGKNYTAGQVVDAFRTSTDDAGCLCGFVRHLARRLKHSGQERLAETYTTSLHSFLRFYGSDRAATRPG